MNHERFRQLLSSYVDNELGSLEREGIRKHLESCESCRHIAAQLRRLRAGVRESADFTLSGSLGPVVLRRIEAEKERAALWASTERAARRLVLALSVLVICVVGVGSLWTPEQPIAVDRYLTGEPSDSLSRRILVPHREVSKDDILFAAVTQE